MKATTFASILAVSLAGAACSQQAPAETETANADTETAQPQAGEFNLRYPTSGSQDTSNAASGEFNLRIPDRNGDLNAAGEVRLPDGAVRDDALSGIEEVRTPDMIDPGESAADEDAPEDEIIRLDP